MASSKRARRLRRAATLARRVAWARYAERQGWSWGGVLHPVIEADIVAAIMRRWGNVWGWWGRGKNEPLPI